MEYIIVNLSAKFNKSFRKPWIRCFDTQQIWCYYMGMFRFIIVIIVFILVCILTIFVYPFTRLLGLFNPRWRDISALRFVQGVLRFARFLAGAKIECVGLENLPKKGEAVVYISNHRGFFDVIATYPIFNDCTGFIAKKEMRTWPLLGWWMGSVHCLFLDREDRRAGIKTILEGAENVKKGISMWIFPEGHRSKVEGEMLPFKHGSFKMATKAKAPIVPVAINGSGKIFDDHVPIIKPGKVRIEFMKPIETKDMTQEEIQALPDQVYALIEEKVKAHADI